MAHVCAHRAAMLPRFVGKVLVKCYRGAVFIALHQSFAHRIPPNKTFKKKEAFEY